MQIYPALDLLEGQCVRLKKGQFEEKTVYSDSPHQIIQILENSGAKYLHLVDLSGAKNPLHRQRTLVTELIAQTSLKIQYGGGIRSSEDIRQLLNLGIDRVVLGSIAVSQPPLTLDLIREFGPDRITLALDVFVSSSGYTQVATQGWRQSHNTSIQDLLFTYIKGNVSRILCTDIGRDGMMTGPNFDLYRTLITGFPEIEFQASGGIRNTEDLQQLESIGCHSAIVGRALYEGQIVIPMEATQLC